MSSHLDGTGSDHPDHPIAAAVAHISAELDRLTDTPTWSMSDDEIRATLPQVTRLTARLAELETRLATTAHTRHVEDASGATSTAVWWANQTQMTRAEAHRKTHLATALDTDQHAGVREALAAGDLLPDQARVIIDAVGALPDEVSAEIRTQAEGFLLDQATDHDAKALRTLGRHLLEVIDPDTADAHEAAVLAKEEAAAYETASLRMTDDGHGTTHGRFTLPTATAAMLKKALLALAAPKHRAAIDGHAPVPGRPSPVRLGQALVEYVERYPLDRLPDAGGLAATVVVTMPLETLHGGLKACALDTGEHLSPGEARRLLCEAGIIPAVLGGDSQVLDLGRTRRFHTGPQRLAAGLRHHGCATRGCDMPPGLCHLHHPRSWDHGGGTDSDGIPLCPRHHHHIHDPRYHATIHPDGTVSFHRRC